MPVTATNPKIVSALIFIGYSITRLLASSRFKRNPPLLNERSRRRAAAVLPS
jgi:uncharacterized protein YneF (UPF0154 family)